MHNKISKIVIGLIFLNLIFPTLAADIQAGKAKAATCVGCHGLNGIAIAPNFPNLAGQKQLYLKKAIISYRDGIRNDPTMKAMTQALNDEDIDNLAAYFASLARKK